MLVLSHCYHPYSPSLRALCFWKGTQRLNILGCAICISLNSEKFRCCLFMCSFLLHLLSIVTQVMAAARCVGPCCEVILEQVAVHSGISSTQLSSSLRKKEVHSLSAIVRNFLLPVFGFIVVYVYRNLEEKR